MKKSIVLTLLVITTALVFSSFKEENVENSLTLNITCETSNLIINKSEHLKIKANLINDGDKTVKIVMPGDGSQTAMRTPIIKWSVIKMQENQNQIMESNFSLRKDARCGNINGLKESDLIELKPGQTKLVEEWIGFPQIPNELGKYRIQLLYKNDPKIKWKGTGYHNKRLMRKVRKTNSIEIISNEIIVEVNE